MSQTMPSRTYEVFALVAVPGFLRSMEFTVHSDWTSSNRSDGTRVGTAKASKYLRRYRWLQKRVGETWRWGRDARNAYGVLDKLTPFVKDSESAWSEDGDWDEDNIFLGEFLADRLELLEASLPLRKMRKVFLPYADVSERMTNTAGIENLQPKIYQITPFHIPSHHKITITIEGKNFDTGRVQVFVAGTEAKVKIANDRTIVAEVPERKFIGDLDLRPRKPIGGKSADFKANVNDLEGLAMVTVITPVGVATDTTLIRLTKKELPVPAAPVDPTAELTSKNICLLDDAIACRVLEISLSKGVGVSHGVVILKDDAKPKPNEVVIPVVVDGTKVRSLTPFGKDTPKPLQVLMAGGKEKTIKDIVFEYGDGKTTKKLKVKGELKLGQPGNLEADLGSKTIDIEIDKDGKIIPDSIKIKVSCAVCVKSGKAILKPKQVQGVTFTDPKIEINLGAFSGESLTVKIDKGSAKMLTQWLTDNKQKDVEVEVRLEGLEPSSGGSKESVTVTDKLKLKKK